MKRNDSTTRQDTDIEIVHDDPVVDKAADWFVRLQNTETDDTVRQEFQKWLLQDPRHEFEFQTFRDIWGATAFDEAVAALNPKTMGHQRSHAWTVCGGAVAACIALIVGLWQGPDFVVAWQADYMTAPGDQSAVVLPDGSSMLLNTDTAVTIDFQDGRRHVRLLKGEAFFDVKHDQTHPFHVASGYGDVAVKGTAFSVRTDSEETKVILERGRVDVVCLCASGTEVQLLPGQTVTASAKMLSPISNLDADRALAWRNGRITFDDVQLVQVISELSRYYPGRIFIASNRAKQLVVSGNYRLDNIEGAISMLADVAGVSMTRLPGGVIILR